jgi:hypothetical protein
MTKNLRKILPASGGREETVSTNKRFWMKEINENHIFEQQKNDLLMMLDSLNFSEDREKLHSCLTDQKKENQQTHTYNELAMGYLLRNNGYEIKYENKILFENRSPKTPDWYVNKSNGNPEFILEVLTTDSRSDETIQKIDRQVNLLEERLNKIPFDAIVQIDVDPKSLDASKIKKIAKKIELVLKKNDLIKDSCYEDKDINFRCQLKKLNVGRSHLLPVILCDTPRRIDEKRFLRKVSEKASRYRDCSIPLVIAPFVDMGISQKILKTSLISDYLKSNSAISAIVWTDRVHPSVDGWIINIAYNKNSPKELRNIFKDEKSIISTNSMMLCRVAPKTDLRQSLMYDKVQEVLEREKFSLRLKNNNVEMYCHWNTPISSKFELLSLI